MPLDRVPRQNSDLMPILPLYPAAHYQWHCREETASWEICIKVHSRVSLAFPTPKQLFALIQGLFASWMILIISKSFNTLKDLISVFHPLSLIATLASFGSVVVAGSWRSVRLTR